MPTRLAIFVIILATFTALAFHCGEEDGRDLMKKWEWDVWVSRSLRR